MKVFTKEEIDINKEVIFEVIENGAIFIHPTDTIYGIGCNASVKEFVDKLREIKGRPGSPFSVIAPSKKWIRENCFVNKEAEKWLRKLPGAYTLILKARTSKRGVAKNVAPALNTLGVRIPNHWFGRIVEELGIPVVTTSANKAGGDFMTSLEDLDDGIKSKIEFIIYEGEKCRRPSAIVDLTAQEVRIKER